MGESFRRVTKAQDCRGATRGFSVYQQHRLYSLGVYSVLCETSLYGNGTHESVSPMAMMCRVRQPEQDDPRILGSDLASGHSRGLGRSEGGGGRRTTRTQRQRGSGRHRGFPVFTPKPPWRSFQQRPKIISGYYVYGRQEDGKKNGAWKDGETRVTVPRGNAVTRKGRKGGRRSLGRSGLERPLNARRDALLRMR